MIFFQIKLREFVAVKKMDMIICIFARGIFAVMESGKMDKYINKQATIDWMKNEWDGMVLSVFDGIKQLPTADVVEAVRCSDCKHSYESVAGLICSYGVCVDCVVRDDFYCSYGERKDGNV